jgi:hypothetical protein
MPPNALRARDIGLESEGDRLRESAAKARPGIGESYK